VEIHHELWLVYSRTATNEGTIRMLKDGWTNVHNEERSGQPSVMNDFVQSVGQKLTISEVSCEFPQISCTVIYEIITG
jgi:hypothetical protein